MTSIDKRMKTPAWKAFERFVAQIEAALAPIGASVTSPDRVPDLITGQSREVDAAIRYRLGDRTGLVTVECRDRRKIEDSTWIEQLVTKRASIGATKTIAVTSRKFSEPALRKAAHFGIEARTLRDVRPQDIPALLNIHYQEACYHSVLHHLGILIDPADGDSGPPPFTPEVLAELKVNTSKARVFRLRTGEKASWNDQYTLLQRDHSQQLYEGVPLDGTPHRRPLRVLLSDELWVDTVCGERRVRALDSIVEIFVKNTSSKMTVDRAAAYSNTSETLAHAAAYGADASFGQVNLITVAPAGGPTHLTLEIRPKNGA